MNTKQVVKTVITFNLSIYFHNSLENVYHETVAFILSSCPLINFAGKMANCKTERTLRF